MSLALNECVNATLTRLMVGSGISVLLTFNRFKMLFSSTAGGVEFFPIIFLV